MIRRFVCALLALILALGCAACAQSEPAPTTEATTEPTTVPTTVPETEPETDPATEPAPQEPAGADSSQLVIVGIVCALIGAGLSAVICTFLFKKKKAFWV